MKKKYHKKVFKLGLSMGEICHHRRNNSGCIFCLPETFTDDIKSQTIDEQIAYLLPKMKKHSDIFIAYFQDETSFDLNVDDFKSKIESVLKYKEIKEITISTRPDVLKIPHLEFLSQLEMDVNIEIGVQTINERSLQFLNRGHNFEDIKTALKLLKKYDFRVGAHIILGIPNETFSDYLNTINYLNSQEIDEIKIHNLVAYRGTKLGNMILNSEVRLLNLEEYLDVLLEIIPFINPEIVISRLFTSNLNRTGIALNSFPGYKKDWMNKLVHLTDEKDIYQGSKFEEN
jgi:radical SAM protein (TIGR01212 family)